MLPLGNKHVLYYGAARARCKHLHEHGTGGTSRARALQGFFSISFSFSPCFLIVGLLGVCCQEGCLINIYTVFLLVFAHDAQILLLPASHPARLLSERTYDCKILSCYAKDRLPALLLRGSPFETAPKVRRNFAGHPPLPTRRSWRVRLFFSQQQPFFIALFGCPCQQTLLNKVWYRKFAFLLPHIWRRRTVEAGAATTNAGLQQAVSRRERRPWCHGVGCQAFSPQKARLCKNTHHTNPPPFLSLLLLCLART